MEYEYSSKAVGTAGLTTGIIGTALGVLNGGTNILGLNGGNAGKQYITKDELNYVQQLSDKNLEIAILKADQDSEKKMTDIYERITTRLLADERQQSDWNAAQAVYNATSNSAIAVLQNQVGVLNSLTKTVVPIANVCPQPMPQYNSWTSPTSSGSGSGTGTT